VKRYSRDEPMWVAIHMCMEEMLAKQYVLLSLMFSLQQNQRTRRLNRFCPEAGGLEGRCG
jgi:hypothetical protein